MYITVNRRSSGPKSAAGKRAVSANALKHGVQAGGLLRCRKERCFYFEACPIYEEIDAVPYAADCPLEAIIFDEAYNSFKKEVAHLQDADELARELAMLEVQTVRVNNALALNCQLLRSSDSSGTLSLEPILRYRMEIMAKRIKLSRYIYDRKYMED